MTASLSALEAPEHLKDTLRKAWLRCSAESTPLTVILVGFDKPETPEGAAILERALHVHCARTHDVVVRRTSDQFAAVLPNTTPAGARLIGDRLIEAMRLEHGNHTQRVSVGIAVSVPDENREPGDLLRRAESALKFARDSGGDRCAGGGTSGTSASAAPKGFLDRLQGLLGKRKNVSGLKRKTD